MSDDDQADRNEEAMREVMRQEELRRLRQEQAAAQRAQGYARDHRDGGRNR